MTVARLSKLVKMSRAVMSLWSEPACVISKLMGKLKKSTSIAAHAPEGAWPYVHDEAAFPRASMV